VATFSAAPIYSSLTASSAVATDASKALVSVTNTGTGNNVLATSPTLVTPILGTPTSGSLVNCTDTNYTGFKNRIINGAMGISQRNGTSTVTPGSTDYLTDRFTVAMSQSSKFTGAQSSTAPTGFSNSLIITSSSAYSVLSTDYFVVRQAIEGFNFADCSFGTASASTITLSFWVRSSLTGAFGGSLYNSNGTRSYPFTYTINAANTFEQKTITIAGDTTGTWVGATNGIGIYVSFSLGAGSTFNSTANAWAGGFYTQPSGSTSVVGTSGATWYVTGVQLEKGSTATSFDYRPYGTELALCQRYYQLCRSAFGGGNTTVQVLLNIVFRSTMRGTPNLGTQGAISITDGSNDYVQSSGQITNVGSDSNAGIAVLANFTGLTVSRGYSMRLANSNAITLSAEL
jgi:hypothetical protein